jgi:glyoxylase-like metal-dependent hydrolase (beta-lactamase superfamily II)
VNHHIYDYQAFFIPGIAHSSYLLGGVSSCLIIDPCRDPDLYITAALEEGFTIAGILETHLHADFISGHLDLHEMTGAPIYVPKKLHVNFLTFLSKKAVGSSLMIVRYWLSRHRPYPRACQLCGYTRKSRGEPIALFPGDTLFVGDVGRPDFFLECP